MAKESAPKKLAIVLSGGGARGAYEAGVIHYIRTALPHKMRTRNFDIHCGASVGALNTAYMAATAHDMNLQGQLIKRLWENVREEDIYRRDKRALWEFVAKKGASVVRNLLSNKISPITHFNGFLDTAPFLPFIEKAIPWNMISENIKSKFVQAVSIVATNVFTGRTELFVEHHLDIKYTGQYIIHNTPIQPVHCMASAAIPLVFPTVAINGIGYTDGGLRLNTPLSPAIQLGADSILVIGLHHRAKVGEKIPSYGKKGETPPLGQVLGRVMNSIFLDRIQNDLEQLERINRIIEWGENLYGKNFLEKVNKMIGRKNLRGDIADRGLKKLNVIRIRPSKDIGEIFHDCYKRERKSHFSTFERVMLKFLDINSSSVDFLSYIAFMPEYLKKLIELGFEDAKTHHNQLKEFLDQ